MITESAVRYKCPLDSMSKINCHGEIAPHPRIEPATPGLQSDALPNELSGRTTILLNYGIFKLTLVNINI